MTNCKVEDALLACDVTGSAFSNCTYDVAYLNYYSPEPLITPVSLFYEQDVVEYFRRIVRLEEWPYLKSELVLPVFERSKLADVLVQASQRATKEKFWRAARGRLLSPHDSARRALDAIEEAVGSGVPLGVCESQRIAANRAAVRGAALS
jgi:hypothetical protein